MKRVPVLLVALGAVLWSTDIYFRGALVSKLSPAAIVLAEDAIAAAVLFPVLIRRRGELNGLGPAGWLVALAIAIGPQAIATVLFTASLTYGAFAETYVVQQTQPLMAVGLAWLLLGERRTRAYWFVCAAALAALYCVVFAPDLRAPMAALQHPRLAAGLLALAAALLWGSGTVLGRLLTARISAVSITGLRLGLALPMLAVLAIAQARFGGLWYRPADGPALLGLALVPGVIALLVYHRGLTSTPASLATIAEMCFPVAATLAASLPHPFGFGQPLYAPQVIGTVVLLVVVVAMNVSDVGRRPRFLVRATRAEAWAHEALAPRFPDGYV